MNIKTIILCSVATIFTFFSCIKEEDSPQKRSTLIEGKWQLQKEAVVNYWNGALTSNDTTYTDTAFYSNIDFFSTDQMVLEYRVPTYYIWDTLTYYYYSDSLLLNSDIRLVKKITDNTLELLENKRLLYNNDKDTLDIEVYSFYYK